MKILKPKFSLVLWMIFILFLILISSANANQKAAAIVNGTAIIEDVLLAEINKKLPLISIHSRVSERRFQEIRSQVLNELIEEELLYQEAKKRKLKVNSEKLNQRIKLMKSRYSSERIFLEELAKINISYDEWVDKLERRLLIRQLQQQEIVDKIKVTNQDAHKYYKEKLEKFVVPERLKLLHILVSVDPGAMKVGWEAGLEKTQKIYKRIIDGEDFSLLAQKLSDDTTSRKQGGDIGWLHVGQLLPELDEAARQMKVGEVSQPVRTIYGYHLLKLEGSKPSRQLSFEEIDVKTLKTKLQKKLIEERREDFIKKLRAQANIQIIQ